METERLRVEAEQLTKRLSEQIVDHSILDAATDEDTGTVQSSDEPDVNIPPIASISGLTDPLVDDGSILIGTLLWMREPIKDSRTDKPKKYAVFLDAKSACAHRSPTWRLPSVREFRALTKNGRINDDMFPDFPIGPFWASPGNSVAISASGALETYEGSTSPMALCVKDVLDEDIDNLFPPGL